MALKTLLLRALSLPGYHRLGFGILTACIVFLWPAGLSNVKDLVFMIFDGKFSYFLQLQHEARLAVEFLDNRLLDGFEVLFMKPVPFAQKFDQFLL